MKRGYVKLWRKSLESLVFGNEKCWKIWCWCLMKANHKPNIFLLGREKITLKDGQFLMGSKKESEFLGIAKSTLWFWLDFLEKEKQLELKKTTKYTIITIPNWKIYQEVELKSDSNEDADGTQIGTNKNVKECISIKKKIGAKAPATKRNDIDMVLEGIRKIVKVLDGSQKEQRFMVKNFIDSRAPEILRQSGNLNPTPQQVHNAIFRIFQLAQRDEFHSKNCTSIKYVYNKAGAIVMSSKKPDKYKVDIIS